MKRQILALSLLLIGSLANANPNVTPTASNDRQKFVCFTDRNDGMADYEFHAIVDWDGDIATGVGLIIAVRYGNPYYSEEDKRRTVHRFNFDMVSEETPYEQFFKFKPNNQDKQLLITWRQDFDEDVPVQHYLKYQGAKYKFQYCQSQENKNYYTTPGYGSTRGLF